jgi:hypothetical protein
MKLIIPKTYILENLKLEKNRILLIFKLLLSRNFLSLPIFQEKKYLTFLLALTFYCSIFRKIIIRHPVQGRASYTRTRKNATSY